MANTIVISKPELMLGVTLNTKKAYKVFLVKKKSQKEKTPVSEIFMGKNYSEHLPKERREGHRYQVHRVPCMPGQHHATGQKLISKVFFFFDEPSKILTIISKDPKYAKKVSTTISETPLFKEEIQPYTHMVKLNDEVTKENIENTFSQIFPSNFRKLIVKDLDTKDLQSRAEILETYTLEFVEE